MVLVLGGERERKQMDGVFCFLWAKTDSSSTTMQLFGTRLRTCFLAAAIWSHVLLFLPYYSGCYCLLKERITPASNAENKREANNTFPFPKKKRNMRVSVALGFCHTRIQHRKWLPTFKNLNIREREVLSQTNVNHQITILFLSVQVNSEWMQYAWAWQDLPLLLGRGRKWLLVCLSSEK